ncbi:MAG: AsmA family protein [Burkholderiales bacterium]|nr:AsmA family protein [Burkholderiales bacterium]
MTLPRTPAFALQGRLGHEGGGVWRLAARQASIGGSLLAGNFLYDPRRQPAMLSGRLSGARLLLSDLGPAVGTPGEGAASAQAPAGERVLPQREFDFRALRSMDADVDVAVDMLDLGSEALAPLRELRTRIVLEGGVLQLRPLSARVVDGRLTGFTQLDGRERPARWSARLELADMDLAGWIRSVRKPPARAASESPAALQQRRDEARHTPAAAAQAYLTGLLNATFDVTGTGGSTAQILGSLEGRAEAHLREGSISHLVTELAGADLAQTLGVVVRGDRPLPLRCARVRAQVHEGVLVTSSAVLDSRDSTLRASGRVSLREETLAMRVTARPKDFSPLALRVPVLVAGPWRNPEFGIEGRGLARRSAAAVALGALVAPAAALLPLIERGRAEVTDPCAP